LGTLYIVPTPIGNLEDITLRALRILREVSLIAAEDTRTSRVLLDHYDICTPLTSYHEHNKLEKLDTLLDALALGDVALISDAGTPGISDPGYELVVAAVEHEIRVEPLPGASSLIPALVASGLPTDSFIYLGFVPRKTRARRQFLLGLRDETRTLVMFESPNRLVDTLNMVGEALGERPLCVAREISKKFEEFTRGTVQEVRAHYAATPPRGEVVIVVGGKVLDQPLWDKDRVQVALQVRLDNGESLSQAAKAVAAESGWNRRDVYALGTN
jgi:16S rRNA (cytidine1402-2'-O)-methyltransferase